MILIGDQTGLLLKGHGQIVVGLFAPVVVAYSQQIKASGSASGILGALARVDQTQGEHFAQGELTGRIEAFFNRFAFGLVVPQQGVMRLTCLAGFGLEVRTPSFSVRAGWSRETSAIR